MNQSARPSVIAARAPQRKQGAHFALSLEIHLLFDIAASFVFPCKGLRALNNLTLVTSARKSGRANVTRMVAR